MSYNPNPEWAAINLKALKEQARCSACNVPYGNFDTAVSSILEADYYNPRHIPPELYFMCEEESCSKCEVEVKRRLIVTIDLENNADNISTSAPSPY